MFVVCQRSFRGNDAEDCTLGVSSPNGDEQFAVWTNLDVAWCEAVGADWREEQLRKCLIGGIGWFEWVKPNVAECPVENENAVVIFLREQSMSINDDAGGRAAADFVERGHGVRVVAGARPAALVPGHAPAVMPADGDVVQACRCVPRQEERPLGVTVIGKYVTTPVEVKIVRIAKAACQCLKYFAIRRKANDCTTLGFL